MGRKTSVCYNAKKIAFISLCLLAIIGSIIIAVLNLLLLNFKTEREIAIMLTTLMVLNVFLHLFGIIGVSFDNYVLMMLFAYGSSFSAVGNISWALSSSNLSAPDERKKKISPYITPAIISVVICMYAFHIAGAFSRYQTKKMDSSFYPQPLLNQQKQPIVNSRADDVCLSSASPKATNAS